MSKTFPTQNSFLTSLDFTYLTSHSLTQPIADDFDMKEVVVKLLVDNDFEDKRARMLDVDDFLKYAPFFG